VVTLLFPAGCKKAEEKLAEKFVEKAMEEGSGGKADIDISGDKITITSKEGGQGGSFEFSGGKDLKLPADFPGDVPVYPDAAVISLLGMGGENRQVTFQVGDKTAEVYAFYQKKLPAQGWEVVTDMKMTPAYSLVAKKGNRQTAVIIGEDGEGSTVALTVTEEKG
jgi:3-dehydroquinate synthase class II